MLSVDMGDAPTDRATEAFRRLLSDAAAGGQAKVDALVALSQRTLFVATWTPGSDDFRTLVNSSGQQALPVFSSKAELDEAAGRFGWAGPDGSVPHLEVGARKVFRRLVESDLGFLIIDIASDHSLECERAEIEPLMGGRGRSDSSGPYAAVGRISETMLQAVKPASGAAQPPGSLPEGALPQDAPTAPGTQAAPQTPPAAPPQAPPPPAPAAKPPGLTVSHDAPAAGGASATFGSGAGSVSLHPLAEEPSDELLDALSDVLRGYPEVEWAAFALAARGPTEPVPTVGLRVDTAYRARVNEIIAQLKQTGDAQGASLDVLLLDDPSLVRAARSDALVFFPWRRRSVT